jgi:hypothetical protein
MFLLVGDQRDQAVFRPIKRLQRGHGRADDVKVVRDLLPSGNSTYIKCIFATLLSFLRPRLKPSLSQTLVHVSSGYSFWVPISERP